MTTTHNQNQLCLLEQRMPIFWEINSFPAPNTVFSLNFSLAGKGPFFTGKAKNMCQRRTLLPGEGLRVHEGFYFRASSNLIDRKFSNTSRGSRELFLLVEKA